MSNPSPITIMSIRSEAMSYRGDVSYELRELLRKNGMRAQLAVEQDRYKLLVQGHDSPMLSYDISEQQFRALGDGGSNYDNKKAYRTFNQIVGKDFDVPSSYVAARNVNGRVAMGLHGYRERPVSYPPVGFLGWTPRQQEGLHLRRMADVAVTPIVAEHADGRLRPGELQSGGYGYYYKGSGNDPLQEMQQILPQTVSRPRPQEPAKPYNELITSNVYFTNEKWQQVLASHGILVDAEKNTLTIQSSATRQDFVYDLTDEKVRKLTDNSLKSTPMKERLGILNRVISGDFQDKITMDTLNSREPVSLRLKPEVEAQLNSRRAADDRIEVTTDPLAGQHHAPTLDPEHGYANGRDLEAMNDRKGWYREGKHGRDVEVGDIWVEKTPKPTPEKVQDNAKEQKQKQSAEEQKFTYRMSAVINGEVITHDISKKQFDKYMAVDDYQRQRMMSKIFHEVDMKTRPEMRQGFNLGAFLGAGLTALSDATFLGADIAHNVEHIKYPHSAPEFHQEVHGTGRIYVKPGVDSPQDIAERAFDAGLNAGLNARDMGGHSR
jgi:hypothetical protein